MSNTLRGTLMVLAATIAWSFSGLFARLLTVDVWTAVAGRSFFGGLFLCIWLVLAYGKQTLRVTLGVGWPGVVAIACSIIAQATTVSSLFYTSVANVTVIYATCPFLAAGLAWYCLGERVPARTLLAIATCMAGVVIVVSGSSSSGHLLGDALAGLMTLSFAVMIVLSRAYPAMKMIPVMAVSAVATFLLFLPLATPAAVTPQNWLVLAAFGMSNMVLALFLFLVGSKFILAATSGLIGTLEIVLAPIWVFVFFDEVPSRAAFVGGAVILTAIVAHLLVRLRPAPAPAAL